MGGSLSSKPPLLGELFFDYLFYDPNDFVKIKQKYFKPFDFDAQSRLLVAVHFRGTDFPIGMRRLRLNSRITARQ